MQLEEWNSLHNVLISCFLEEIETLEPLLSITKLLYEKLTTANITLFILAGTQYEFLPVDHHFNDQCFSPSLSEYSGYLNVIKQLKQGAFEAAIALTTPVQSPFSLAYLCYLAQIPIRIGQSQEFGGGVLSHCIQPPTTPHSIFDYNLHLLKAIKIPGLEPVKSEVI